MYCTRCGIQIEDTVNYCPTCGNETPHGTEARLRANASASFGGRRLYRWTADKKIAGVCSGIARYFEVDPTLIRLLFAASIFISGGITILAYLAAWIIVPPDPRPPMAYPAPQTV